MVKLGATIGTYFEHAAANWDVPGYYSGDMGATMYVPDASADMTDTELQSNYDDLLYRLDWWTSLYNSGVLNSTEKQNVSIVVAGYTDKKSGYDAEFLRRQPTPTSDGGTSSTATGSGQSNMMLWLAGGVGLYLFWKHRKKKK